ncbi:MAG TPA: hypothetical protein VJR89_07070, partial [Polyangiales bacterium]|nr:hypothetical protein [Polyangiales bacterium]
MRTDRRHWLCALSTCAVLFAAAGCDDDGADGGLVVRLESDLALPKDLDLLRVEVTQNGQLLLQKERDLPDAYAMPLEFQITPTGDSSDVLVRAVGYKYGEPRIERSAILSVPTDRTALLTLPLRFVCLGRVNADGASSCGEEQTCRAGECGTARESSAALPIYDARALAEPGLHDAAAPECLDVMACFEGASEVDVDASLESCAATVQRPS